MPTMPWEHDWPAVANGSREPWEHAKDSLRRTHEDLIAAARELRDDRLSDVVADRKYDFYFLLDGLAQDAAYHSGEIAMLLKGQTVWRFGTANGRFTGTCDPSSS
jgi:hypothetical protein